VVASRGFDVHVQGIHAAEPHRQKYAHPIAEPDELAPSGTVVRVHSEGGLHPGERLANEKGEVADAEGGGVTQTGSVAEHVPVDEGKQADIAEGAHHNDAGDHVSVEGMERDIQMRLAGWSFLPLGRRHVESFQEPFLKGIAGATNILLAHQQLMEVIISLHLPCKNIHL